MPFCARIARYIPIAAGTSPITVSRYTAVSSCRSPSFCAPSASAVTPTSRKRTHSRNPVNPVTNGDVASTQRRRERRDKRREAKTTCFLVLSAFPLRSLRLCVEKNVGDTVNLAIETVTQSAHIAQVARLRRVVPDLAPQVGDMVVHNARRSEGVVPPRRGDQLIAAQHASACANEGIQQLELDRRKFHRPPAQA